MDFIVYFAARNAYRFKWPVSGKTTTIAIKICI